MPFYESSQRRSAPDHVTDLVDSVKQYAKQETLDPIRGAARWVAVGTLASLSLGLALVFFALAILRLSQYLGGDTLSASWSFVHYFITFIVVSALVALSLSRIQQRSLNKES
ncbi:unannotated protein [freshwater metagenome]|uniref:Unannotated protein n=1 Tax=freshwater metagenome TaxID=449393 RepID=A0A6J6DXP7_9ZZZZ|nr:hypothetical protein [Actinomycetota bacterium]